MRMWLIFLWKNELNRAGPGSGIPAPILFSYSNGPLDGTGLCQIDLFQTILRTRIWELAKARETFQIGVFPTAPLSEWQGERVKWHGCSVQEGLCSRDWREAHWMSWGSADISSCSGARRRAWQLLSAHTDCWLQTPVILLTQMFHTAVKDRRVTCVVSICTW